MRWETNWKQCRWIKFNSIHLFVFSNIVFSLAEFSFHSNKLSEWELSEIKMGFEYFRYCWCCSFPLLLLSTDVFFALKIFLIFNTFSLLNISHSLNYNLIKKSFDSIKHFIYKFPLFTHKTMSVNQNSIRKMPLIIALTPNS